MKKKDFFNFVRSIYPSDVKNVGDATLADNPSKTTSYAFPHEEVLLEALRVFGRDTQLVVVIEELSELIQSLCKSLRNPAYTIDMAEIADVIIMLAQLRLMADPQVVDMFTDAKIGRLNERIKEYKQQQLENNE